MTGEWEQRLRSIAYGQQFSMPAASDVIDAMDELTPLLNKAAADPGITGATGMAAAESMSSASARAAAVSSTTKKLHEAVAKANDVRSQAQTDLGALGSGQMNGWQEAIVRGAAIGATIAFPGFSVIAGDGAVGLVNWFLGNQREDDAKKAVAKASDALDAIAVPDEVSVRKELGGWSDVETPQQQTTGPGSRSFDYYPGANTPVIDHGNLPKGLTITGTGSSSGSGSTGGVGGYGSGGSSDGGWTLPDEDGTTAHIPPFTDDYEPHVIPPGSSGADGGLTSNGPNTGWTGSGGYGSSGSGFGSGAGGYGAGGSGSGMLGTVATGGAVAGTSGAALFGGARMAGAGFGAGGAAAVGGASSGSAGRAVGAGGMGAGAGGRGGAAGAGAGRTGGLLGGTRSGAGAGAAASGSAGAGAGGRSGMMGGGGAPGGRGREDSRQEGRGLGGPIAPRIEDDEERGPRSAAAGAGGRD